MLTNYPSKSRASQLESAMFALAAGLPLSRAESLAADAAHGALEEGDCYSDSSERPTVPRLPAADECPPTLPAGVVPEAVPSTVRSVRQPVALLDAPFEGEGV